MARTREYTEDEIAHALAVLRSNGGNAKQTASQLGVPRSTLRAWAGLRSDKQARDIEPEKVNEAAMKLSADWRIVASGTVDLAKDWVARLKEQGGKVTSTDLKNVLIAAGVATEKESFARGGPSSRTEQLRASLIDPDALRSAGLRVIEGGRTEPGTDRKPKAKSV